MPHVDFQFSRDWTHAGIRYASGEKITLPETKAQRLKESGAGKVVEPDPPDVKDQTDQTPPKRGFFSSKD